MNTEHLDALLETAQLRARILAYEIVLDEIMATTTDPRAQAMASGVLGDYAEDRKHERGTV